MSSTSRPARRRRDETGAAAPSYVVVLSVVAVAMAGIALIASREDDGLAAVAEPDATTSAMVEPSQSVAPTASVRPKPVKREEVNVEVYNTSSIKQLAARTAERASILGWQVLGTDNWSASSIPAPTIYYGPRLEEAAELLGKDLGIRRIRPSVDPMKPDRITVILDRTYAEG